MASASFSAIFDSSVTVSMSSSSRTYFSGIYLRTADAAAIRAIEIEQAMDGSRSGDHRQSVVTAIIMSAAALEASINEACCDVVDGYRDEAISPGTKEVLELCWSDPLGMERLSVLRKIELFIKICGDEQARTLLPQLKGNHLWEHAGQLIDLRNLLMHYRPITVSGDASGNQKLDKLMKQLESQLVRNALTGPGDEFYPAGLLGKSCAQWAVQTASMLIARFCEVMGLLKAPAYLSAKRSVAHCR